MDDEFELDDAVELSTGTADDVGGPIVEELSGSELCEGGGKLNSAPKVDGKFVLESIFVIGSVDCVELAAGIAVDSEGAEEAMVVGPPAPTVSIDDVDAFSVTGLEALNLDL